MKLRTLLCLLLGLFAVAAVDDSLQKLGLTKQSFEQTISDYLLDTDRALEPQPLTPSPGRAVAKAYYALPAAAQGAVVKDLALAAKAFVMSPAFQARYEEHLKQQGAVNHGIEVTDSRAALEKSMKSGDTNAMIAAGDQAMREMFRTTVNQRLQDMAKFDAQTMEIMADADEGIVDMVEPKTAAEKARNTKAKALLKQAKAESKTNIEQARKTYRLALMTAANMKDETDAKASQDNERKSEEQRKYNQFALKPNLKKGLQQFVTIAKSVNFNAPTATKSDNKVFVNAADERRSNLWKMLYRLGPAGTAAAAQVAQAWAAEL